MGFLERAIRQGVSNAVGNAVGNAVEGAVKEAVSPVATKYANKAAQQIDDATAATNKAFQDSAQAANQASQATAQASSASAGLEGAFANLTRSMENMATQASQNMKICPSCKQTTTADKAFCPSCGSKLPEQTVAQGAVCTSCGKQNTIGTRFCSGCGAKLPAAIQEEQEKADKDASTMAQWSTRLPYYPVWSCGGGDFEFNQDDQYTLFDVTFTNGYEASQAVEQYKNVLRQNGFREAGQYPSANRLYKKVNGVCYQANFDNCFDGGREIASIYFLIGEPEGGFDYVKPQQQPKQNSSIFNLFK